jgi:hypothetical protein
VAHSVEGGARQSTLFIGVNDASTQVVVLLLLYKVPVCGWCINGSVLTISSSSQPNGAR